jgi:nucleoside-diphosphate-sugar epimerase
MKYLVTGATGYIGAHLVKQLSEQGHTVHALVRNPKKAAGIQFTNVVFFEGDITNTESMRAAIKGCDYVFHLAAFAKVWAPNPKTYFDLNVGATVALLQLAKEHRIKRCVVTSTAGVFGASLTGTITENSSRDFDFFNEYESSKALSESKIKDFVIDGLDVVIVSPTRVYGPYLFGEPEAVTLLIKKFVLGNWRFLPGDGSKEGNYVYVHDVVQGHLNAMETGTRGHTYILGGFNHSYTEFFSELSRAANIKRTLLPMPIGLQTAFAYLQLIKTWFGGEPLLTPKWVAKGKYHWRVSPQKAVAELGLALTPLREGIEKTVQWIQTSKTTNK